MFMAFSFGEIPENTFIGSFQAQFEVQVDRVEG